MFRESIPKAKGPRSLTKEGPRVIYIPRVKYSVVEQPSASRVRVDLGQRDIKVHGVSCHVRKVGQASAKQLFLAQRYGVDVPTGYTFVRPHERGKKKRDVLYRSRSAMQAIFGASDSSTAEVKWFKFETDVRSAMRNLGFDVQHLSANHRGGVDIFAAKGSGLEEVHWIIECKCWSRKVGPNIVRELVGRLAEYPRGTKGMVVTTSAFTRGAEEAAETHGIELVDGDRFIFLSKLDGS